MQNLLLLGNSSFFRSAAGVYLLRCAWLFVTLQTAAQQASLSLTVPWSCHDTQTPLTPLLQFVPAASSPRPPKLTYSSRFSKADLQTVHLENPPWGGCLGPLPQVPMSETSPQCDAIGGASANYSGVSTELNRRTATWGPGRLPVEPHMLGVGSAVSNDRAGIFWLFHIFLHLL